MRGKGWEVHGQTHARDHHTLQMLSNSCLIIDVRPLEEFWAPPSCAIPVHSGVYDPLLYRSWEVQSQAHARSQIVSHLPGYKYQVSTAVCLHIHKSQITSTSRGVLAQMCLVYICGCLESMVSIVTCQAQPVLVKKANQMCGSFLLGLVHLWTDQRIPGPVSCCCPSGLLETPSRWHGTVYRKGFCPFFRPPNVCRTCQPIFTMSAGVVHCRMSGKGQNQTWACNR